MTQQVETWLQPDALFDGRDMRTGVAVCIQGENVTDIRPLGNLPEGAKVDARTGILSHGFFDIQINGGADVLFNSNRTPEALAHIAAAHLKTGTTHWLPTVITDSPEVMAQACDAVCKAYGHHGVAGIHIEGPHISMKRRGTHAEKWIRPFDDNTLTQVRKVRAKGIPVLITVAPESISPAQVSDLVKLGAVVSLGHTDANSTAILQLLNAGATVFTHLFNAMSQMENREPNVVGTAINSMAFCSVIADGLHVNLDMIGLAIRARPVPDHMILVTDAMPSVGGKSEFILYGQPVRLVNGRLINSEGSLAGAHVTMPEGLSNLVNKVGVAVVDALRMATSNPAAAMGLDAEIGLLTKGTAVSDLVMIAADLSAVTPLTRPAV